MRIAIIILLLGLGGTIVVHERRLSAELVTENARHRAEAEQLSVRVRELEREIVRTELDITNTQKTLRLAEGTTTTPSLLTNHAASISTDAPKSGNQSRPDFLLHKRHLSAIGLSALTPELRLSDEIAALLALTPEERQAAQERIDQFASALHEAELTNLRPTNQPPDSVAKREGIKYAYYLPPMEEEGKALQADLIAQLETAIGPQRAKLLQEKLDWQNQFNNLGKDETFITFIDVPKPDGSYQRHVSIKHPHDETTYSLTPGDLPKRLSHLFRIEPGQSPGADRLDNATKTVDHIQRTE